MFKIVALTLAAGLSTRMGSNKLLAEFSGKPLIRHVAEAATASNVSDVFVVTGHERELVERALIGLPVTFVYNENYADGMAGSLKKGIAALSPEVSGVIVLLGDMPLIRDNILNKLVDAFKHNPSSLAVVPTVNGERGNPVLIARGLFNEISKLTGDKGARHLLEGLGDKVLELPLEDRALLMDVDTPEVLVGLSAS